MGSLLHTIVFFVIALGVLIAFHEFGHFWVARKLGVKVTRFSIGFGKPLWRYQKSPEDTEFVVAALPLGGYVKMVDENEGPVAAADLTAAFNRQSLAVRSAIVAAGPVFNLLLAIGIYWLVLVTGEQGMRPVIGGVEESSITQRAGIMPGEEITAIGGDSTPTWELAMTKLYSGLMDEGEARLDVMSAAGQLRQVKLMLADASNMDPAQLRERIGLKPWQPHIAPVIGTVEADSPAAIAGLKPEDRVISANGQAIGDWLEWVEIIRTHPDQEIEVVVERGSSQLTLMLWPALVESDQGRIGRIGAAVNIPADLYDGMRVEYRLGVLDGLMGAVAQTWEYSLMTLRMMGKMLIGQASVENLSGPISIAQYAGQSASMGWVSFAKFLAIVSISLGVLNLLPIPVLDGGHLLFNLLEWIKGKPLSEQAIGLGQQIGMALLLGLMGLAFFLDIERLVN